MKRSEAGSFFRNVREGPRLGQPLCLHSFTSVSLSLSPAFSHPLCLHTPLHTLLSASQRGTVSPLLHGLSLTCFSFSFYYSTHCPFVASPPSSSPIWVTFALHCQSSCRSHSSLKPGEYESLRLEWKIRQRIIYLCCKLTRFNEQLIKINQYHCGMLAPCLSLFFALIFCQHQRGGILQCYSSFTLKTRSHLQPMHHDE